MVTKLVKIKKIMSRLSPLIGITLFILIIREINLAYFVHELPPINWGLILVAPILISIMILIKSWRWKIILKKQGINHGIEKSLALYLMGLYLGAITPSRVGELGKIYYLKKDRQSLSDSSMVTILDKIIDFGFVLIFGLIGLATYHIYFQFNNYIITGGVLILIIGLILFYYVKNYLPKIYEKLIKTKQKIKLTILNYHLFDYLSIMTLTISAWLIYFFIAYIFSRSVGLNINFWYVALVMNLASLASILPISIMGLGTRESIFIFFYSLRGANTELAIAVSMLIFINNLLPVLTGFIIWLFQKDKKIKS